ncbi:MAG: cyclic nucleotide-binding domain-containing protein [Thermoleophilia bacterium]|nr:cyclic nucleotide-binding domain-containing protein [Thermoleophilia bacterium]
MIDSDSLVRLALFADLSSPQVEAVSHVLGDERFVRGTRVVRRGLSGGSFFVVLEGAASVEIDGSERARLTPGDFFGEVSALTGEPTTADVVAATDELRCAVLPGEELRPLLLRYPAVAIRMLETGARRLRNANLWQP